MLYVVGIVVVIAISGLNGDSGSDAVVSLITALFAGVYTQGRAARVLTWNQTQRRAKEDPLTGALTRYGEEKWREALAPDQSHGMVMACDIDDFTWFNDTWGHNAGDEVLQEVVKRFQSVVRPPGAVCRRGGDELMLWLVGVRMDDAEMVALRIHGVVSGTPLLLKEHSNDVGCSMGWAVGDCSEDLVKSADQALLTAKRAGKDRVVGAKDMLDTIPT